MASMITTLSYDGAGLVGATSRPVTLHPGQIAGLDFFVKGRRLSIRSSVAWHCTTPTGQTTVGLQMMLALCSPANRSSYTDWFLESLSKNDTLSSQLARLSSDATEEP